MIEPVKLTDEGLVLLDQRALPAEETYLTLTDVPGAVEAIRTMVVRGAPAIGITAAYGLVLAARAARSEEPARLVQDLRGAGEALMASRPTAVNLGWAVRRILGVAGRALEDDLASAEIVRLVEADARAIHEEDLEANRTMGRLGSIFVPDGAQILTHCNAGALATAGYGTALGLIRAAVEDGKAVNVLADETRPFLQGARLTAWELQHDGIPVSVITDNMAGFLMARGEVDLVIVGSDRIAMNGDVANKIGTYMVAVLARRHGVPFYVAAPTSTIDPDCPDGADIPIEERDPGEVTHLAGHSIAPEGVGVRNPAFDVTPAELVTAIVTEKGIVRAPYERGLRDLLGLPVDDPVDEAGDQVENELADDDEDRVDTPPGEDSDGETLFEDPEEAEVEGEERPEGP